MPPASLVADGNEKDDKKKKKPPLLAPAKKNNSRAPVPCLRILHTPCFRSMFSLNVLLSPLSRGGRRFVVFFAITALDRGARRKASEGFFFFFTSFSEMVFIFIVQEIRIHSTSLVNDHSKIIANF
jgi:hypothetical protein